MDDFTRTHACTHTLHTHLLTACPPHASHDFCSGQDLPCAITLQAPLRQAFPLPRPPHSISSAKPSPVPPPRGSSYPSLRSSKHPGSSPFSQGSPTLLWDSPCLKVPSSFPHHYLSPLAIILRFQSPGRQDNVVMNARSLESEKPGFEFLPAPSLPMYDCG